MAPDLFRLDGKIALVTGARTGLGRALACGLAEAGCDLLLAGRTEANETLAQIKALGRKAVFVRADLNCMESIPRIMDVCISNYGRLDILVNNAGTTFRSPIEAFPETEWDRVMNVNCKVPFFLCQAAGKEMLKSGKGKIINVASVICFSGGLTIAAYAASKGGLAQFTRSFANEWASRGINVNAIAPGYFRTDITRPLQEDVVRNRQILDRIPAGRWGDPNDLKGAVVYLASGASDYVHGQLLVVDGGWMAR
jgi:2-deoxy-D-gluconate 3-dehydrogenase